MSPLFRFLIAIAVALSAATVFAQTKATPLAATVVPPVAPTAVPKAAAKAVKKPVTSPAVAAKPTVVETDDDDDGSAPDTQGSVVTHLLCDHGSKITFYYNPGDDEHAAIRWNKDILRMRRVATSTGAHRFESKRHGLVWIGIPSKSMLLDSRKGQQLANECKSSAHETPAFEAIRG